MKKKLKTSLFLCMVFICIYAQEQSKSDILIPIATDTAHALSSKLNYRIVKLAEGDFSNPLWSPDGKLIAFTNKGQSGIFITDKEGKTFVTLTNETGAGYKFSWSLDNEYIAYRATSFNGNKRMQYIKIVNVKDTLKVVLVSKNGIQPPVWQYSGKGKRVAYVIDSKVILSDNYPFTSEEFKAVYKLPNINKNFFYKSGHLYLMSDALLEASNAIEGMDPVISPDRKSYIYSFEGKLHLRDFDSDTETVLGIGSHPSWAPDGSKIVYQQTKDDGHVITDADLYIMNLSTKESYPLTSSKAVLEVNPSWSPDGKSIVFNGENDGAIYLLIFN